MPCFNEEEGIYQFVGELQECFKGLNFLIIAVDDFSGDRTSEQLELAQLQYGNVEFLRNTENLGHGPSTLAGLKHAFELNPKWVLTVDGDGQFDGKQLRDGFDLFSNSELDILEGVRVGRNDPYFRKIITWLLRVFVLFKTKSIPADANTPFRIYSIGTLDLLLHKIKPNSLVPNLEISILSRKLNLSTLEYLVAARDRLGANKTGTTWNSTREWLPSSRFIRFCFKAFRQLFNL